MIRSREKAYGRSARRNGQLGAPGSSHHYMLDMIGAGKRVLEFGCAEGYMSEMLKRSDCHVTGIEIDAASAALAREFCDEVIVADLDTRPLVDILPATPFEVAVFGDVLEHLRDPWRILDESRALLAPHGYAVMSIPNIAHGSVRLALLRGRFDYVAEGLLDDTHLRFFTLKSIREMCLRAGYRIERIERTRAGLFEDGASHPSIDAESFDPAVIAEIQRDPEHETLQYIIRASVLSDDEKFDYVVSRCLDAEARLDALGEADGSSPERTSSIEKELATFRTQLANAEVATARLVATNDQLERERRFADDLVAERDGTIADLHDRLANVDSHIARLSVASAAHERSAREAAAQAEYEGRRADLAIASRDAIAAQFSDFLVEEIAATREENASIDAAIADIRGGRLWLVKRFLRAGLRLFRGRGEL